jgi:hypothetical protein
MSRAFACFERVTLVRVGPLDVPPRLEAMLAGAASEFVIHPGGPPGRPGLPPSDWSKPGYQNDYGMLRWRSLAEC